MWSRSVFECLVAPAPAALDKVTHGESYLGPVDFAAAARACGARGVRVESDAAFEGVLRTALAASGPTVIQLALDRGWVSVDEPATAAAAGPAAAG